MASGTDSAATRFKVTTMEFFDFIAGIIGELNETGLTEVTSSGLVLPRTLIGAYDAERLINFYIGCADDWDHIANRNDHFILEVMPAAYNKIPFDVNLLTIPLRFYREYAKTHPISHPPVSIPPTKERTKAEEDAEWPVLTQDIGYLWEYFVSMVDLSLLHIEAMRRSDPGFASNVDVARTRKIHGL